jgi:hypothetical protein
LLADLKTFAEANGWITEEYNTDGDDEVADELFIRGPGSTPSENVHVNIETFGNTFDNIFGWGIRGAVSYDALSEINNQPSTSPVVNLTLANSVIEHWFYVSDRRIIVVAKVGTSYFAAYMGFMLPFATPIEYPFPLYVGATADTQETTSFDDARARNFADPGRGAAYVREAGGTWKQVSNHTASSQSDNFVFNTNGYTVWPFSPSAGSDSDPGDIIGWDMRPLPGEANSSLIIPLHLAGNNYNESFIGILENAFYIPGFGLTTEQQFSIGTALASGTLTLTANAGNTETVTIGFNRAATGNFGVSANPLDTETVVIDSKTYTFQTTLTNSDGNVQIGVDAATSIANLVNAINLGAGSGTAYAAATTLHPTVSAAESDADSMLATAKTPGTAGNAIATTETVTGGFWQDATLTGGTAAKVYTFQTTLTDVDGNVLIGATASDSIDNLIAAINLAPGAGTDYANSMTLQGDVTASAGAGDTMVLKSREFGSEGNSIVTTETMTNGSFAAATLTGGAGTDTYTIFQNVARNGNNHFFVVLEE